MDQLQYCFKQSNYITQQIQLHSSQLIFIRQQGYDMHPQQQFYSMAEDNPKLTSNKLKVPQLNKGEVNSYFQGLPPKDITSLMVSQYYSDKIMDGLQILFREGKIQIEDKSKSADELLDQQEMKEEQLKAIELKAKKHFIEKQLALLKSQTSVMHTKADITPQKQDANIILSKQQHRSLIKKIKRDKQERQRKHHQLLTQMHQKQKQKEQLQQKLQQQRQNELLKLRREQIQKNISKHKDQQEQFARIQRESKEKIKDINSRKFMYQQIQQKYQKEVVFMNLQEKKKKLKELRQYKSFNIEELKEHQQKYLQKKKLHQSRATSKEDWNYHPPQRSQRLALIIEEEKLEKIRKLQEKKKELDQKLTKKQEYVHYLRENFIPKIDNNKRQEIEKRLLKEKEKQAPQPTINQKEIGIGYLQQAKKLRKKIDKPLPRPQTQRNIVDPTNATNMSNVSKTRALTNYLSIDHNGQHYQKRRRKNLEKLLKSQGVSQADKIKELRFQAQKINENMKRKEKELKYKKDHQTKEDALQLLLSSISAKIGIIQMYQ